MKYQLISSERLLASSEEQQSINRIQRITKLSEEQDNLRPAVLVNLHGIGADGQRVLASPINFQTEGYWTMPLPFGRGIEKVELVIATEQEILKYPFDFKAKYPAE